MRVERKGNPNKINLLKIYGIFKAFQIDTREHGDWIGIAHRVKLNFVALSHIRRMRDIRYCIWGSPLLAAFSYPFPRLLTNIRKLLMSHRQGP